MASQCGLVFYADVFILPFGFFMLGANGTWRSHTAQAGLCEAKRTDSGVSAINPELISTSSSPSN
jgi:hypothetical protein